MGVGIRCRRSRSTEQAPEFADDQDPGHGWGPRRCHKKGGGEHACWVEAIGDPVVATDDDGDVLTYTLGRRSDDGTPRDSSTLTGPRAR